MSRYFGRWLPRTAELKRNETAALGMAFFAVIAIVAITALNAAFDIGGAGAAEPIRDTGSSVVYILVAAIVALRAIRITTNRIPAALFATGLSLYGLGNVLWSFWIEHLRSPPIPSICDGLWLSLYPLSYCGIVGFARARDRQRLGAWVWLDGIIAGAGLAAIGAALVFRQVLASTTGSSTAAVATELAYPIGDLLLAALVAGVLAVGGWRINRAWALLGGGFLLLAVADCLYAVQVTDGSSTPSRMTNFMYVLAVALLAFAMWQPEHGGRELRLARGSVLLIPAGFATAALGLLLYDHVHRLDPLAFGLAILTLLAAILRMALTFRDVLALAEARRQASTDDLTALPNRRFFIRRIGEAIAAAALAGGTVWVLILDLDNFKELNDTLGHAAGDALLGLIGPRLRHALRSTDILARLGGDEFAILLDPEDPDHDAGRVAEKLLECLREPFDVRGLALRMTGSLGLSSFPAHAADVEELMKHADIAMYQAKATRSGYAVYASERNTNSPERLALAAAFASGLENGCIEVHFQPQADVSSRRIDAVEALVRWRRADGQLIPPLEFLAVAEQTGLSRALTQTVLTISLDQLREWRLSGRDVRLSVNTTVADLLDDEFPEEVGLALAGRGLPPDALVVEVTETSVMSDPGRIGHVLAQLAQRGIGLSLDDFGTGYSSLAHLKTLPVGEVKIDRSFVARMCDDHRDAAIVKALIRLAHELGLRVVAEGVENEETWQALLTAGCDLIQGYALARPIAARELEPLLPSGTAPLPA